MEKRKNYAVWVIPTFIVWLVINIRVEAGYGTGIERTLDGLVAGGVLLVTVYYVARFLRLLKVAEDEK